MRIILLPALLLATAASAAPSSTVSSRSVRAHEDFLAGDALRGRGSATHDEEVAAAYVASQFEGYGLQPAPGMPGYVQTAGVIGMRVASTPTLEVAGRPVEGMRLIVGSSAEVQGPIVLADSLASLPETAAVVVFTAGNVPAFDIWRAVRSKHIGLLIAKDSGSATEWFAQIGGRTSMPRYLAEDPPATRPSFATLPAATIDAIKAGEEARLAVPIARDETTTSNAIGYLPGTDPKAGVILLSAHLDHLGQKDGGPIMHGANDDASGTTAVLELAQALAAGKPHRRGILFICYGSEEIGQFGSRYYGAHPAVPLSDIVANIEFEMIGAQDPKLPKGTLMMTGFDRSDLGSALQAHGGHVAADPYPKENFFQRSDNYQLALKGVVAHTVTGWAEVPTYHQPTDTIANLDIGYMTSTIQSLIAPVRWLADGNFTPRWTGAGRPTE
ncbi:M28 family peptidase [Sphingomonas sp. CGMCC 1.13654]|uniref:M28 family peptidase n=1 Tax=Sphingomonas chungangi TaxID=2683589 RepID=A0A838L485_9SPHN|nr:M28 family peptidase [Sphingomonas chungangi]MBA2934313.1 M28 family peptidase [Sphingomonas chungangi]MVW57354.1 M28 family peptidase [Sphingomonas chungangi]